MSVIVKGMEMPESCDECKLCSVDSSMIGYCYLLDEYSDSESTYLERQKDCPLIEIPTPHGRLVDADKLFEEINIADEYGADMSDILRLVIDAPTVIKAEG